MKDLEKSTPKNFVLLGTMPRRKSVSSGIKATESFRPMRSCIKKPSFKPKMLSIEVVSESNAK